MVVRRARTLSAEVDDVWQIVRDPYHLPRWWPKTERVERVNSGGWTSVLMTDKGRTIRADYRVELSKGGERRIWAQELAGTPFEGLFREVVFEIALSPTSFGTQVVLETRQKPKGWARFGGVMLRRAAKRQADAALAALAGLVERGA